MKRLELLDWGRFLAALMVLAFHYAFNGIANGKIDSISHIAPVADVAKYGYLGVELFFMISGYVIFYSANSRTPAEFAVSRAIRLYPAYWVAVMFTAFAAFQLGGGRMAVDFPQVLANLTMLQSLFGVQHVDGVYWTLMYEISFYGLVFILLLVGAQAHLRVLFIAWPFLMLAAHFSGFGEAPFLGGYYSYFAAGALFAILRLRSGSAVLVGLAVAFYLCLSFAGAHAGRLTEEKGVLHSTVVVMSIVSVFFALFFVQNIQAVQRLRLPGSRLAGALTYPLYLVHAHVGYMLINRFATEENKVFVYLLVVAFVIFVAFIIHRLVEQKCAVVWRWLFEAAIGRVVKLMESNLNGLGRKFFRGAGPSSNG